MPRISRKSLKSSYFHVIVQGIEKRYIFEKHREKEKYIKLLMGNSNKYNINILAYCIMDNHAHMLIFSKEINDLSKYMKSVNTSFALYFNKINNRVGYVFRDRFRSEPIKSQGQLYRTLTYIHLNPVAANMCRYPELYLYSTYNDFIKKKGIAKEPDTLNLLELDKENYVEIFKFMHYMHVEGTEFDNNKDKILVEEVVYQYIKENNIKDIIFESDKVKGMIEKLKKQKISISKIAKALNISTRKLKDIISE